MPRHIAILLLALLVVGLVALSGRVVVAGEIRYAEARVLDASPGYIVNFTGSYPGYGNMIIQYDNGTLHTMEILEEVVLGTVKDYEAFTYSTAPTTVDAYRIRIDVRTANYYVSTIVYGHEYTGSMGANATVKIYFDSHNLIVEYNGTQVFSQKVASGDTIIIDFNSYKVYVNGNDLGVSFTYIWKIEKNKAPPASPNDIYTFSKILAHPEIRVDGNTIANIVPKGPRDIVYNGTHIVIGTDTDICTGTISYVNSTSILRIYYYMEPETITQTITSTVTETETETVTETMTETVTHTINNTITMTNTITSIETLTVNNTITKYVPYYSGGSSIYLAAVVVFVIIMVLVGIAVSAGRGRGR